MEAKTSREGQRKPWRKEGGEGRGFRLVKESLAGDARSASINDFISTFQPLDQRLSAA